MEGKRTIFSGFFFALSLSFFPRSCPSSVLFLLHPLLLSGPLPFLHVLTPLVLFLLLLKLLCDTRPCPGTPALPQPVPKLGARPPRPPRLRPPSFTCRLSADEVPKVQVLEKQGEPHTLSCPGPGPQVFVFSANYHKILIFEGYVGCCFLFCF